MKNNPGIYASPLRRLIAYGVDAFILFLAFPLIFCGLIGYVLFSTVGGGWMENGFLFWLFIFLTVSVPFWLYYSFLESSARQATIGMRLFGLKVADAAEGERIGFGRALLRTVIKLLPFEINHLVLFLPTPIWSDPEPGFRFGSIAVYTLVVLYLGVMFLNKRRQSIHDLAAGTVVLRDE